MSSIRRFLVIVIASAITLFNFIAALQGYRNGIEKTETLLDRQLIEISSVLQSVDGNDETILEGYHSENIALQSWRDQDTLLRRSDNAPEMPMAVLSPGFSYNNFNGYRWRTFVLQDLEKQRWIVIAERSDARYLLAEEVILSSVLPIVIGLPVMGLLIWLIVGSGLRPIKRLAGELAEKKPEDLSPLSDNDIPEELQQLVRTTNDLLERLANSFERERRFSGDAAHELRTPLSIIKIELFNLTRAHPEEKQSFEKINNAINRMGHLIEQLLTLYRMNPEQFIKKFHILDLETVARKTLLEQYPNIQAKKQNISLESESALLNGDEFALQTLIKNLVDNANKYTPEGGEIVVSISNMATNVSLVVEDSGPGIPEEFHARIFERFYRIDGDQHKSQVMGCGLGMSIVKHIVDLHHGSIHLSRSKFATGLRVEVLLPRQTNEEN